MPSNSVRPGILAAVAVIVVVAALFVWTMESPAPTMPPESASVAPADHAAGSVERAEDPHANRNDRRDAEAQALAEAPADPVPYIEGLVWGDIDLREAREAMPDNLYWQFGAPTKDEEVLAAREEEKKLRNEQYGRVLAGDASEDEVHAYYDYRRRMSEDYYEFAEFMHRRHQDNPDDRFVGMLELAMKMHLAKLAEIPKEEERALEHSRQAALAREEWKRQQEEFGQP